MLQPPQLCSFQNSNYSLEIFPAGAVKPLYEVLHKPIAFGETEITDEIDAGFQSNSDYYTIITFETELTEVMANISFSKC